MTLLAVLGLLIVLAVSSPPEGSDMAVFGEKSMAHACPVDGVILTAKHVTNQNPNGAFWSDQYGNSGVLHVWPMDTVRDLGRFSVDTGDIPVYHKLAEAPEIGDEVYWIEYDWSSPKNAMQPKRREAKIVNRLGGYLILDEEPTPGASGSCVLSKANTVLGVLSWGQEMHNGSMITGAVDLTIWFPKPGE
jgi:hypothetical protein